MMEVRFLKRLRKKARKGLRGWPIATIAFYGPNLSQATKVTVGIVPSENAEVKELRDWKVDRGDIRGHPDIAREILEFIEKHRVLSVAMTDSIEWLNVQNTKVGFCNLDAESEPIKYLEGQSQYSASQRTTALSRSFSAHRVFYL
jgi:hypothetical protein